MSRLAKLILSVLLEKPEGFIRDSDFIFLNAMWLI